MTRILFILFLLFTQVGYADIHYPNASQNKSAQVLFDKGMLNYYGYLYVQAEYDFRQALIYDESCGICHWGLAIAKKHQALEQGKPFAKIGYVNLQRALQLTPKNNSFEYDVVKATVESFSLNPHVTSKQLQINFINALRKLHNKYKNDAMWREESLALLVDAMAYYPNASADEHTVANHCGNVLDENYQNEAVPLMAAAMNNPLYKDHPGILHTYIHLTERDLNDALSLKAAEKLSAYSRGEIAHYTHMANHIYWRRGMYDKAIQVNLKTIAIDKNYFQHNGAGLNSYYYEYHYLHSYQFLTALGILTNNFELAIQNARELKKLMDVSRMEELPDYRDTFSSLEHITLARFNKWNEVLQLGTPPHTQELGLLFIRFSKALAYLHVGKMNEFRNFYGDIRRKVYARENLRDVQVLVLTYLQASEMNGEHADLSKLEQLFVKNKVDVIEKKLFVLNPPIWFFPYHLFLAEVGKERGDEVAVIRHRGAVEEIYPGVRL